MLSYVRRTTCESHQMGVCDCGQLKIGGEDKCDLPWFWCNDISLQVMRLKSALKARSQKQHYQQWAKGVEGWEQWVWEVETRARTPLLWSAMTSSTSPRRARRWFSFQLFQPFVLALFLTSRPGVDERGGGSTAPVQNQRGLVAGLFEKKLQIF